MVEGGLPLCTRLFCATHKRLMKGFAVWNDRRGESARLRTGLAARGPETPTLCHLQREIV